MPRSSRSKSHKKHSSKDVRAEHSESEEEVLSLKERKGRGGEEGGGSVRVSRESSEKKKLGGDCKDLLLLGPGNGDLTEEFSGLSKRRKERSDAADRWNGGGEKEKDKEKEGKGESSRIDSDKGLKSKILVDSKCKSSRRHESSSVGSVLDSEEVKRSSNSSSKVESKSKVEKDLGRKEVHHYKESKEKEHGVDRDRKSQDVRRERSVDRMAGRGVMGSEENRKSSSHLLAVADEHHSTKRVDGNTDWQMQDELRNPELEKELEKRIRRRRDESDEKDKYQDDVKDASDRRLSTKDDRAKIGKQKDEKSKDEKNKDEKNKDEKSKEEKNRDEKNKDDGYKDKYREDVDKDRRGRDDKHRDEHSSKDHTSDRSDTRYVREEDRSVDRHKKSKTQNSDRDGSSRLDDRDGRYKDNRGKKRSFDDDEHSDPKYRRDDSDEKDKYDKYQDDVKDANDRRLSTRDDRARNGRHKDEKNKDEKNKDDVYREKYREDLENDRRSRDDKRRDERSSKGHISDRSDIRQARDDEKYVDYKKSKNQNTDRDGSSRFDDRESRYKDNRGKKRSSDDEELSDLKPRSTKERRYEVERKLSTGKVELLTERGRSQSRLVDADSTVSSSRRKNSPPGSSAHFSKDQYRHTSRHAELKYKDSVSEEWVRTNAPSSRELSSVSGVPERDSEFRSPEKSRSVVKPIHKGENHFAELSADRSSMSDAEASPLPMKEKSHSSASMDRRNSNRMAVRRSLDIEETGRRSSGSKDARDYSKDARDYPKDARDFYKDTRDYSKDTRDYSKDARDYSKDGRGYAVNEDRRSQDWPLEKPAADDFSQLDGDTVTSSFNRNSHLPSGSSSHLPPPPPFRSGVDSPSVYGSEEDSRGKPSNRYRRSVDPNIGRGGQGNAWKNNPSWPSPVTNGYISYQHGPTPGGFHTIMPQFSAPPLFGVRPSMELNQTGVPYHIPDADRFSGHARPFGWRNPADESCPPHMHVWDGSNGVYRNESHMHGRPEWDQNRHPMSDRAWEANMEAWKGQNSGATIEFPNASNKEDNMLQAPNDEVWASKPGQRSRNDRGRPDSQSESIEIKQSIDIPPPQVPIELPVLPIHEKTPERFKSSNVVGTRSCSIYLSKLDISADLTQPELYKKCMNILDTEGNSTDHDVAKHELPEEYEKGVKILSATVKDSLFPVVKDSILQKAMALYRKQADEMRVKIPGSGRKRVPPVEDNVDPVPAISGQKGEPVSIFDEQVKQEPVLIPEEEMAQDIGSTIFGKLEEPVPASDNGILDAVVSASDLEKVEDPLSSSEKVKVEEEPEELAPILDEDKGEETDVKSREVEAAVPVAVDVIAEEPAPPSDNFESVDAVVSCGLENAEVVENQFLVQHAPASTDDPPSNADTTVANEGTGNSADTLVKDSAPSDTMCGSLGITDSTSEAFEALMPESIECRSVNLSRIHHSPKSTH